MSAINIRKNGELLSNSIGDHAVHLRDSGDNLFGRFWAHEIPNWSEIQMPLIDPKKIADAFAAAGQPIADEVIAKVLASLKADEDSAIATLLQLADTHEVVVQLRPKAKS